MSKKPIPTDAAEHTVWGAQQRACQDKQWRVLESAGYPTGGYPLNNLDPCPRAEHSSPKSSLFHSSDIRVFSEDAVTDPWTLGRHTQSYLFA